MFYKAEYIGLVFEKCMSTVEQNRLTSSITSTSKKLNPIHTPKELVCKARLSIR